MGKQIETAVSVYIIDKEMCEFKELHMYLILMYIILCNLEISKYIFF